jgi:hypothetical protein
VAIRTLILALASGAVLAAAALAPVGASAKPMGLMPIEPVLGVKPVLGLKPPVLGLKPPILGMKPPVLGMKPPFPGIVIHPPGDHDHDHDHDGWWWRHHEHPWFVGPGYPVVDAPVAVSGPAPAVSGPVANGPCTCLTKTYLNDGSVLFKDVCTKEAAVAGPNQAQAQ